MSSNSDGSPSLTLLDDNEEGESGLAVETSKTRIEAASDRVRAWERLNPRIRLSHGLRSIAVKAAELEISEGRGIITTDVVAMGKSSASARQLLYQGQSKGLLVSQGKKTGRHSQYFLSKGQSEAIISETTPQPNAASTQPSNEERLAVLHTLFQFFLVEGSKLHNVHIKATLARGEYESIQWPESDRQKKFRFELDEFRHVQFVVSPNGTCMVYIECSKKPFDMGTGEGSVDFFASCGVAAYEFRHQCRVAVLSDVCEWELVMFDADKTPVSELQSRFPVLTKGWTSGGAKFSYLGASFKVYGKIMPYNIKTFRLEVEETMRARNLPISDAIGIAADDADRKLQKFCRQMLSALDQPRLESLYYGVSGGGNTKHVSCGQSDIREFMTF
ncbi:MAG: hypothetical protein ABI361_01000 [Nitrososphaera sp.]